MIPLQFGGPPVRVCITKQSGIVSFSLPHLPLFPRDPRSSEVTIACLGWATHPILLKVKKKLLMLVLDKEIVDKQQMEGKEQ